MLVPGAPTTVTLAVLVLKGPKSLAWPCALGDYVLVTLGLYVTCRRPCSHWELMIRVCHKRRLPWALGTWLFKVLGWVSGIQRHVRVPPMRNPLWLQPLAVTFLDPVGPKHLNPYGLGCLVFPGGGGERRLTEAFPSEALQPSVTFTTVQ